MDSIDYHSCINIFIIEFYLAFPEPNLSIELKRFELPVTLFLSKLLFGQMFKSHMKRKIQNNHHL